MASTKSQKRPLSLSISTMHHNPSGHVAIRQSSISFTILFFSIFLLLCANVVSSSDTSFSSDELHDLDEDEFLNEIVEGMGSGAKHKAFEHADKNLNSHGIDGETINGEDGGNGNANGNNFENVINHESNDVNNDNNLKHASSSANRDKKHQHPKPNTPNFIDRFSRAISQEIIRRFPSIQSPLQKFTFPQFQTPWTKNQKRIQSKHSKKDARNLKEEKVGVVHGDGVSRKGASSLIDIQASRRVGAWCRPSPQKINSGEEVDCSSMQQKDLASSDKSIVVCPPDSGKRLEAIPNRKDYEIEDCGSDMIEEINDLDDLNLEDDVDVQPGTVIFVLPSGDFEQGLGESSCKHAVVPIEDGDETEIETGETTKKVVSTESHCLSQAGQHYGNDHRVIQYALLQREFELGNIDVHRRDFAYQPVVLSLVDEGRNGGNVVNLGDHRGSSGHELDGRIIPDVQAVEVASISSSSSAEPLLQESVGSNDKNSHLTDSAITKRKRRRNQNNDQQVSFRWWSWVSHISQFVHHSTFPGKGNGNGDESVRIESADGDPKGHFHSYQHGQQAPYQSSMYEEAGKNAFAGGSHGEIWRARRRCPISTTDQQARGTQQKQDGNNSTSPCDDGKDLIVKRLKIENGYSILEAGLREVYFGELLAREVESSSLFTTYVDHFFRQGKLGQLELWIVFENAGPSLRSYLYTPVVDSNGGFMVFQHSAFWRRLRKGIAGESKESGKGHDHDHEHDMDMKNEALAVSIPRPLVPKMRQNNLHFDNKTETASVDGDNSGGRDENEERQKTSQEDSAHEGSLLLMEVLKQILTSVAFLHERGIVHRDIKPSNVMCRTSPPLKDGAIPHKVYSVRCLLGDFSSAWDELSDRNLYANGPSSAEQTNEYAPPEVLFQGPAWSPFFSSNPQSYDSWSIGIVALELLLGTPNVFSVDQRTTALLTNRLRKEGANSEDIQRALYLAALSQFCIYLPTKVEGKNWPLRRGDPLHEVKLVKEKCTIRDFHNALRARDPIGTGVDESQDALLHLIWRLLAWDPKDRLSPKQALLHPYFTPKAQHDCRAPSVDMLFKKNCFADLMIPGIHNALESQSLDPKIDMNSSDTAVSEFQCPKCGKTFHDHNSCQKHARSRRHALFCNYDRSTLPQCLNAHSMLPTHPTSGYCDIQGRRRTIEDFHTVHLNPDHQFYGVFDGHMGNLASKYAASSFYGEVEQRLSSVDHNINTDQSNWKEIVEVDLIQSFEDLHGGIVRALASSPGNVMDESGTTATILYVTELAVVIANVGDSRAVLSHWNHDANGHEGVAAMQLTEDHVASSPDEQVQIKDRGGFISKAGGIDRVNGSLAVSRSLGDVKLALFLSRVPHVFALTKKEVYNKCRKQPDEIVNEESVNKAPNISSNHNHPCFIILASDGLWDVMSNQEAVDMVVHVIGTNNESSTGFQEAAELLTHEAYVRGSSDNIGVCVVAIT